MVGLDQIGFKISALRYVARIVASGKHHPVEPGEPIRGIVTRHVIALQERHRRHWRIGMGRFAPADGHVMAFCGEMDGGVATQGACSTGNENLHD